jgi:hypothetical protein
MVGESWKQHRLKIGDQLREPKNLSSSTFDECYRWRRGKVLRDPSITHLSDSSWRRSNSWKKNNLSRHLRIGLENP